MICHKCGERFAKGLKKCPFCGSEVEVIADIELPELKNNEEIVELDDTDTNLTDNYFEVELKDKEEDESSFQYDVAEMPKLDESSELELDTKEEQKKEEMPVIDIDDKSTNLEEQDHSLDFVSGSQVNNVEEENTKEYDLSLEKTRSINPLTDTVELTDLSLVNDINKQIEEMNDDASKVSDVSLNKEVADTEEKIDSESNDSENTVNELATEESIKKRKNVLLFTGLGTFVLAVGIILFIIFGNSGVSKASGDYLVLLDNALEKYYETTDFQDIIEILDSIKKDEEKVSKAQEKAREYADQWVSEYIEMDIKTLGDFEEISTKYKTLLSDLHANALLTSKSGTIKILVDSDYNELMKSLDTIYNDSSIYYVAMDYYNQNDYNRAYTTFERIESSNTYYDKASSYKDKIIANIMLLLETDINKIESDVDSKSDVEKLEVYTQIENVLTQYNNIYSSINLKNRDEYQMLCEEYHDKTVIYTELLSKVDEVQEDTDDTDNVIDDNE